MTNYHKTTIVIEVFSEGEYSPHTIHELADDLINGPHTNTWGIRDSEVVSTEEVLKAMSASCLYPQPMVDVTEVSSASRSAEIRWHNMKLPYVEKVAALMSNPKWELAKAIINHHYNSFCEKACDEGDNPSGKLIPYIGWMWREVDFCGDIPIGRIVPEKEDERGIPGFTGFMVNNKWDYPERLLTEGEKAQVINYLDQAMTYTGSDYRVKRDKALTKLWDYMQSLSI